jgi:hypothetical protein
VAFRPSFIPPDMTLQQYAESCALSQLIVSPLDMPPPVRAKRFLSTNEMKLLAYLKVWLPNFMVFTQVHLLQMINVEEKDINGSFMKDYDYILGDDTTENRKSAYWKIFNLVNLLSVDFILADLVGNPVYAIELDGPEHETEASLIERDKIKAHVLNSITVPLLKIRNVELDNLSLLQQKVQGFAK